MRNRNKHRKKHEERVFIQTWDQQKEAKNTNAQSGDHELADDNRDEKMAAEQARLLFTDVHLNETSEIEISARKVEEKCFSFSRISSHRDIHLLMLVLLLIIISRL